MGGGPTLCRRLMSVARTDRTVLDELKTVDDFTKCFCSAQRAVVDKQKHEQLPFRTIEFISTHLGKCVLTAQTDENCL